MKFNGIFHISRIGSNYIAQNIPLTGYHNNKRVILLTKWQTNEQKSWLYCFLFHTFTTIKNLWKKNVQKIVESQQMSMLSISNHGDQL